MSPSTRNRNRSILPPEIIEAILRLLPPKPLCRFKSVSKTWHSLISNPRFLKTYIHQSNSTKLLLISDTKSLYSLSINNHDHLSATAKELTLEIKCEEILGSCNGLVLAKDENNTIVITNPTTREIWNVPRSPFALPDRLSFVMYGFGYDASKDDYKIVSISFWDMDNEVFEEAADCTDMFVSVYSLGNNCWKKLRNSPYTFAPIVRGVLVNQNLHWLTITPNVIVSFSLADEEFYEIEIPNKIAGNGSFLRELVVVGGKLGICVSTISVGDGMEENWENLLAVEHGFDL